MVERGAKKFVRVEVCGWPGWPKRGGRETEIRCKSQSASSGGPPAPVVIEFFSCHFRGACSFWVELMGVCQGNLSGALRENPLRIPV
jgi:hypothetical protein